MGSWNLYINGGLALFRPGGGAFNLLVAPSGHEMKGLDGNSWKSPSHHRVRARFDSQGGRYLNLGRSTEALLLPKMGKEVVNEKGCQKQAGRKQNGNRTTPGEEGFSDFRDT